MSDSIIVRSRLIFLGGPPLVQAAPANRYGRGPRGAECARTRVWLITTRTTRHALALCRRIVAGLNHVRQKQVVLREPLPPRYDPAEIYGVVPTDLRATYDAREVIARIVDASDFDEFKRLYGTTLLCGFAHIHGYPVGILANNGILFSESALKGAHFVELCSQRGIPLVFLQNITGFMVGRNTRRAALPRMAPNW
jgi:3-methylcrotonyl-CoA carboxylase beta subunit